MSRGKKIFIGVSVSLIVMISVVIVLSYVVLHRPIPDYDGERSVRGIVSPVKIYRDSSAVPYIVAENETDAAYALGYVHAQERFFQMDLERQAREDLVKFLAPKRFLLIRCLELWDSIEMQKEIMKN